MKRHCGKLDRYYARCQKVANGHHSKFPHEKRYDWLIKQEYRNMRINLCDEAYGDFYNGWLQRDCPEDQLGLGNPRNDD
jgi:hypothetical protein